MKKINFIKDNIHGEINLDGYDSWVEQIIRTPEFQRLNYIRQLGLSMLVFPTATHTRFAHSLGVYQTTRKFLYNLKIDDQNIRKVILAAALLHDIGHGPNSHAFENYTKISHEIYTEKIILDKDTFINKVLLKNQINPQDVVDVINHRYKLSWVNDLISSQIDCDRSDYLLRDSHYTGATYGDIDLSLLAKRVNIKNDKIVFDINAISLIENMLIGRYHMYWQVYENRHSVKHEWIIEKLMLRVKELYKQNYQFVDKFNLLSLFSSWYQDKPFTIDEFLKLNDYIFETLLTSLEYEKDEILKNLCSARKNYDHYISFLWESKEFEKIENYKKQHPELNWDYLYQTIQLKKLRVYNNEREPIWIEDPIQNKIVKLTDISVILNQNNNFDLDRKLIVINHSIYNKINNIIKKL